MEDASPGVFIHAKGDESKGLDRFDIDADHVAIPDDDDDMSGFPYTARERRLGGIDD